MEKTKNIYAVYDRVACEYAPFFLANNDAVAIRNFMGAAKHAGEGFNINDYWLHYFGKFDIGNGQ